VRAAVTIATFRRPEGMALPGCVDNMRRTNNRDRNEIEMNWSPGSLPVNHPLSWPAGWKRTVAHYRSDGAKFGQVTLAEANQKLANEMRLLGAQGAVLSCNSSDWPDPGVALHFTRNRQPLVLACDQYSNQAANCRSIGISIASFRALERHGGTALVDRTFIGFAALPPPPDVAVRGWHEVLGLGPDQDVDVETIERAFRTCAHQAHPDKGGSNEAMAELNAARARALTELRE
jgi:hypothetical protein